MEPFTLNQWAILALVLLLGWLLGLLSRSGGGRWRRAYEQEHRDRLAIERDRDARYHATEADAVERERMRERRDVPPDEPIDRPRRRLI
jgi:hypothetical protein